MCSVWFFRFRVLCCWMKLHPLPKKHQCNESKIKFGNFSSCTLFLGLCVVRLSCDNFVSGYFKSLCRNSMSVLNKVTKSCTLFHLMAIFTVNGMS